MNSWYKSISMTIGSAIVAFSISKSVHAVQTFHMEKWDNHDVELSEYITELSGLELKNTKIYEHSLYDILLKYYFSDPADATIKNGLEESNLDYVNDTEFFYLKNIADIFLRVCESNPEKNVGLIKQISEFKNGLKGEITRSVMRKSTLNAYKVYSYCKHNNEEDEGKQATHNIYKDDIAKKGSFFGSSNKSKVKKALKDQPKSEKINIAALDIKQLITHLTSLLEKLPNLDEKQLILLITEIHKLNEQLAAIENKATSAKR